MFDLEPLPIPSPMRHRHLTGDQLGLAEIDDIIGRGDMQTWVALRNIMRSHPQVRDHIDRVCTWKLAQPEEDFPDEFRFWQRYLTFTPDQRQAS